MEEETDSRRTRDDGIRYWTPRLVAIAVGVGVGVAGFWSGGRDGVAFLADWSTFCIQAGAIYLFLFEREFLANLVLDILDFVRRVREYRERRAAERAAAREAARRAQAQAAKPAPTSPRDSNDAPAAATSQTRSPVEEPVEEQVAQHPNDSPITTALEPPRFQSRDRASGFRGLVGLVFVGLVAALLVTTTLRSDEKREDRTAGEVADVPAEPANESITPQDQQSTQTHAVQAGESCWSVADGVAREGERTEQVWLRILAANPELCSVRREQVLRPGSTLEIPPEEPQSTED